MIMRVKVLRSKEELIERDLNDILLKFSHMENCKIHNIQSSFIPEKNYFQTMIMYTLE